jgi:hypothetical protein
VGSEGCQYFGLLARRDLEEVQSQSKFRCDLIEFCGRDTVVTVSFLKTEWRRTMLRGSIRQPRLGSNWNPQLPAKQIEARPKSELPWVVSKRKPGATLHRADLSRAGAIDTLPLY